MAVGITRAAYEYARDYAKEGHAFGKPTTIVLVGLHREGDVGVPQPLAHHLPGNAFRHEQAPVGGASSTEAVTGKHRVVLARHARNRRLADACHLWDFATLTHRPGARAFYDQ